MGTAFTLMKVHYWFTAMTSHAQRMLQVNNNVRFVDWLSKIPVFNNVLQYSLQIRKILFLAIF